MIAQLCPFPGEMVIPNLGIKGESCNQLDQVPVGTGRE